MAQMGFYFDQTRCTGCYTCVVACKDWNDIHADSVNWMRLYTMERGKFPDLFVAYLASPCYHCEEPGCMKACPAGAIFKRDSDGVVVVHGQKCLGNVQCQMLCLKACPWEAPQFGSGQGAKMQKCDFCLERLQRGKQTICVEACPMYALDAGPINKLREKYGEIVQTEGFRPVARFKPSVTFKPKEKQGQKAG